MAKPKKVIANSLPRPARVTELAEAWDEFKAIVQLAQADGFSVKLQGLDSTEERISVDFATEEPTVLVQSEPVPARRWDI